MLITKDMGIMEIVQKYPATVEVLQRFGMGCIGRAGPWHRCAGADGGAEQSGRGLRQRPERHGARRAFRPEDGTGGEAAAAAAGGWPCGRIFPLQRPRKCFT